MKVYKYRGAGEYLERDLNSISENYFYAPNAKKLNDPCETLVLSDRFQTQTNFFGKLIGKSLKKNLNDVQTALYDFIEKKQDVGIYSLSETFNDELMWAHYANNHRGFCIEYDFDILMDQNSFSNSYSFEVDYSSKPPQIEITDISASDSNILLKKIAGTKSQRWSYEKEIRIITDKFGEHDYYYSALKAIYFGYRMPEDDIHKIMERLKGRGLKYFKINLIQKSYSFIKEEIPDKFENSKQYLLEVYRDHDEIIRYTIEEVKFQKPFNKGEVTIILDSKITKEELGNLGRELRGKLFRSAERVYIFYYLKSHITRNSAWGLTHFDESRDMIEINGVSLESESKYLELIKNDNRDIIGHWIDESNLKSLITIFKTNGAVFVENLNPDMSKSVKEQVVSKVNGKPKYQDIDDTHGDYIIIDNKGILNYYSVDGLFNKIKKQPITTAHKI